MSLTHSGLMAIMLNAASVPLDKLQWIGHIVGAEGIKVDPAKTDTVRSWPTPKNASHVRSFLGQANYFRKFIKDFAKIAHPLTELTRKDTTWAWTDKCQQAFDRLKDALTSTPNPEFSQPFEVSTDASGYGLGAVLSQNGHPVAFESRELTPAERNYTTTEQEHWV
jgi:hypothetical protein